MESIRSDNDTSNAEFLEVRAHTDWRAAVAGALLGGILFVLATVMLAVGVPAVFVALAIIVGFVIVVAGLIISSRRVDVYELLAHSGGQARTVTFSSRFEPLEEAARAFARGREGAAHAAPEHTAPTRPVATPPAERRKRDLQQLMDELLELPVGVQASITRSLAATSVGQMDGREREAFLRELRRDVDHAAALHRAEETRPIQ